jgi:YfiH family protein
VSAWVDESLAENGVLVAFTERGGGLSTGPYRGLNLAGHVGDDPAVVDTNRGIALEMLGLAASRERLVSADQVHGVRIHEVCEAEAGSGAFVASGRGSVKATDALFTAVAELPLMMCFADCVPIVLVAPGPMVGIVHAGWRGALAGLPGSTAKAMSERAGCVPSSLLAYIGPHIGACCYEISANLLSQFCNTFGTVARASSGGLDLEAVVRQSLTESGVSLWRITSLGVCTAEETVRFFSYRSEGGTTGRHAAVACIVSSRS